MSLLSVLYIRTWSALSALNAPRRKAASFTCRWHRNIFTRLLAARMSVMSQRDMLLCRRIRTRNESTKQRPAIGTIADNCIEQACRDTNVVPTDFGKSPGIEAQIHSVADRSCKPARSACSMHTSNGMQDDETRHLDLDGSPKEPACNNCSTRKDVKLVQGCGRMPSAAGLYR